MAAAPSGLPPARTSDARDNADSRPTERVVSNGHVDPTNDQIDDSAPWDEPRPDFDFSAHWASADAALNAQTIDGIREDASLADELSALSPDDSADSERESPDGPPDIDLLAELFDAPEPPSPPGEVDGNVDETMYGDLDARDIVAASGSDLGTVELNLIDEVAALRPNVEDENEEEPRTVTGARRPSAPDPDADTGDLPSPAIYRRLVQDYLGTDDVDRRRSIQRRLEEDSLSENAVVRYYAIEAMAHLGRSTFGNALLAATDDEDEAVRNLAIQALNNHS